MFTGDVTELDAAETLAAATDRQAVRTGADLDLIELSLHFADLHPDPATIPGHVSLPGGERGWVCGGPGCPGFAEFAAAEFGAAIGRSAGSAAVFIGQALALRHRLPRILAMVRSGHGEPWKARTIATACLALSVEAAAIVDRRVASIVDTVTPIQLGKIVKAAIQQADPEAARAAADAKAKERGVWAGDTDEHGTTSLHVRAATGDVIHFKATIRQIADALADLGDTAPLPQRKARAIGIIADPALTHELLSVARHLAKPTSPGTAEHSAEETRPGRDRDTAQSTSPETAKDTGEAGASVASKLALIKQGAYNQGIGSTGRRSARTTLYVHITDATLLAGGGVARVERFGPVLAARLQELLGHDQIVVKPVIDLNDDRVNVNAYEIPDRIRERVKLIHPVEQFPYGPTETTNSTDLDHIQPYDFKATGPPGQTSITNLTPLRRYSHRVKTLGGWNVRRLDDGALEWITKHGLRFRVDHKGTHRLTDPPP